jgi:hypothetical protein
MLERYVKGEKIKTLTRDYKMAAPTLTKRILNLANRYLNAAHLEGTPETFYPGEDKMSSEKVYISLYDTNYADISLRGTRGAARAWVKKQVPHDVAQTHYEPYIGLLQELRDQADYWIHQMQLLRHELKKPVLVYQQTDN